MVRGKLLFMQQRLAALAVLALLWAPVEAEARGAAQDEPQEPIEALGRALGMTPVPTEILVPPLCTLGIIEDLASAC